jgi:hypothetical protein
LKDPKSDYFEHINSIFQPERKVGEIFNRTGTAGYETLGVVRGLCLVPLIVAISSTLPVEARNASAAEAPNAKHSKPSCAGTTPHNPPGATADDVLGARLGMSPNAASAILTCANPNYVVSPAVSEFDHVAMYTGPRPIEALLVWNHAKGQTMATTSDQINLEFFGMRGSEKLMRIHRTVNFDIGAYPPLANVLAQLKEKYGEPTRDGEPSNVSDFTWLYGPEGERLAPGTAEYENCLKFGFGVGVNDGCGLSVTARIDLDSVANGGVQSLEIWVVNQKVAFDALQSENADIEKLNAPTAKAPAL